MSKVIINGYEQPRTANIFSDGFGCSEDYADGEGDGSAINDATDGFGDGSPPDALPPRGNGYSDGYGLGSGDGLGGG